MVVAMSEIEQEQNGATEYAHDEQSEAPVQQEQDAEQNVAADTTENTETDEQKNERILRERQERSRRAASRVQQRFDELTRDKYAERAARERVERELDELRRASRQQQPQDGDGAPKRDQFDDYESYIEARASYRATKEMVGRLEAMQRQVAEQQRAEHELRERNSVLQAIADSTAKFRSQAKDFDDAMEAIADIPSSPILERAIATADNPAAILYALGKDPERARNIAMMDPLQQAKMIGKIEYELRSTSVRVSNAPAPGKPAGAKGGAASEPPEDPEAYFRWAEKNLS